MHNQASACIITWLSQWYLDRETRCQSIDCMWSINVIYDGITFRRRYLGLFGMGNTQMFCVVSTCTVFNSSPPSVPYMCQWIGTALKVGSFAHQGLLTSSMTSIKRHSSWTVVIAKIFYFHSLLTMLLTTNNKHPNVLYHLEQALYNEK